MMYAIEGRQSAADVCMHMTSQQFWWMTAERQLDCQAGSLKIVCRQPTCHAVHHDEPDNLHKNCNFCNWKDLPKSAWSHWK